MGKKVSDDLFCMLTRLRDGPPITVVRTSLFGDEGVVLKEGHPPPAPTFEIVPRCS